MGGEREGLGTGGAPVPGESVGYTSGPGVRRAARAKPYERRSGDPLFRPLRIFTLDPGASRLEGREATVDVPYEPLDPGPKGAYFEVDSNDGWQHLEYRRLDLDDRRLLLQSGCAPSPSNPLFHQQMVYAVASLVHATFRRALGRDLAWGFDRSGELRPRLRLRPFAARDRNAYYLRQAGEIAFGYDCADDEVEGRNLPGGFLFTCLSHDVIVHEVTHALLDGLRSHFLVPTGPDVLAFHEAFADLVAIFQHFTYREVVLAALRKAGGRLGRATLLADLAVQFGQTTGRKGPLRSPIHLGEPAGAAGQRGLYDPGLPPHELGSVLVSAVFDAFCTLFERRTERLVRLATGGSGRLPENAEPSTDLLEMLASEASKLAGHLLSILIRAIDYCPPADLTFGEYLRALITADHDLVPHDPYAYREALIDAFLKRRIYPRRVPSVSEDALLWQPPPEELPRLRELSFAELELRGDPGRAMGPKALREQAHALGRFVSHPRRLGIFGLVSPGEDIEAPRIQSIRSLRRVGPDGQLAFNLVAEVTQRTTLSGAEGSFDVFGGSTIILDPEGRVELVIHSRVENGEALARQQRYVTGGGSRYWRRESGRLVPEPNPFRLLHAG